MTENKPGEFPPRAWVEYPNVWKENPNNGKHWTCGCIPEFVSLEEAQAMVRAARIQAWEEAEQMALRVAKSKNNAGNPEAIGAACALAMTFSVKAGEK